MGVKILFICFCILCSRLSLSMYILLYLLYLPLEVLVYWETENRISKGFETRGKSWYAEILVGDLINKSSYEGFKIELYETVKSIKL